MNLFSLLSMSFLITAIALGSIFGWEWGNEAGGALLASIFGVLGATIGGMSSVALIACLSYWSGQNQRRKIHRLTTQEIYSEIEQGAGNPRAHHNITNLKEELFTRGEEFIEGLEYTLNGLQSPNRSTRCHHWDKLMKSAPEVLEQIKCIERGTPWPWDPQSTKQLLNITEELQELEKHYEGIGSTRSLEPLLQEVSNRNMLPRFGEGWQVALRISIRLAAPSATDRDKLSQLLLLQHPRIPGSIEYICKVVRDLPSETTLERLQSLRKDPDLHLAAREKEQLISTIASMEVHLRPSSQGGLSIAIDDTAQGQLSIVNKPTTEGGLSISETS